MTAELAFSLVIPAYNEAKRLPPYLSSVRKYLDAVFADGYEVIVVDDGGCDRLADTLQQLIPDWRQVSLLRHPDNLGKGRAVRTGIWAARGGLVLFADADGATPIEEERKLRQAIEHGAAIAVGSRLVPSLGVSRIRGWCRKVSGILFARVVRQLFRLAVQDTQCGFKMFRREVASRLLPFCQETGYLFDLEILAWAHRLGYRVAEIPVSWKDVPASKVHLVYDGWVMLRGLWRLRRSFGKKSGQLDQDCEDNSVPMPASDPASAPSTSARL